MLKTIRHGTATDLPPLLIVHGLFGSARNWGVIAKRLSDSREVIAVDLRNHGESPWHESHTYADLADDLAEVMATLPGPVDLVGHSMGGKAAMMLALTHPEHLNRLVIADIAPVAYSHTQLHFIEKMRAVDLERVTRRSEAAQQLAELGVEPALQSFFTQSLDVANQKWKLNLDALEANMPVIMTFPDIEAQWDGPALFLSGADSDYVTSDNRDKIRSLFPSARFAKLPGAGHWLHADKPREFEATLRVFLD
ncbi:alpha/beta fold hydrolase [Sulfitobacter sp. BDSS02]|nr:alpha/beta fold hydrolase [Sulfitobacter sp. BDSS02]MBR9849065.1 alpha/beta fold hydrolase [Paracoccaceae bacterium]